MAYAWLIYRRRDGQASRWTDVAIVIEGQPSIKLSLGIHGFWHFQIDMGRLRWFFLWRRWGMFHIDVLIQAPKIQLKPTKSNHQIFESCWLCRLVCGNLASGAVPQHMELFRPCLKISPKPSKSVWGQDDSDTITSKGLFLYTQLGLVVTSYDKFRAVGARQMANKRQIATWTLVGLSACCLLFPMVHDGSKFTQDGSKLVQQKSQMGQVQDGPRWCSAGAAEWRRRTEPCWVGSVGKQIIHK